LIHFTKRVHERELFLVKKTEKISEKKKEEK